MRVLIPVVGLCLLSPHGLAFNLDGFFSGMTQEQAKQKMLKMGVKPEIMPLSSYTQMSGGDYKLIFCESSKLIEGNKDIDTLEFNHQLKDMMSNHGEPHVEISAPTLDVIYISWRLNDGSEVSLNS